MVRPDPGFYNLRILRSNEEHVSPIGGMYATGQAPDQVVRLAPVGDPGAGQRGDQWRVEHSSGDIISTQAAGMNAGGMTYMFNKEECDEGEPIILGPQCFFRVEHRRDVSGMRVYSLSPTNAPERIGATCYVGQMRTGAPIVGLEWVPVIPDAVFPVWGFTPTSPE